MTPLRSQDQRPVPTSPPERRASNVIRVPNRLRTAAGLLTGPREWWLALQTIGWLIVLPLLKRLVPLPRLARFMWSRGSPEGRRPDGERSATEIVRGFSRSSGGNCLERSLILYRFLSRENADPALVTGVGRAEGFIGHAWVEVEGRALLETDQTLAPYVEIMRFGQEGSLARPPEN